MGEGTLPIAGMMDALRSVNYSGFVSLEWDPKWFEPLGDPDIIFPQFTGVMSRFASLNRKPKPLYYNRAGTGRYV